MELFLLLKRSRSQSFMMTARSTRFVLVVMDNVMCYLNLKSTSESLVKFFYFSRGNLSSFLEEVALKLNSPLSIIVHV